MLQRAWPWPPSTSSSRFFIRLIPHLSHFLSTAASFSAQASAAPPLDDFQLDLEPALLHYDLSSSDSESPSSEPLPPSQVLRAFLRNPKPRYLARVREQGRIPAVLVDPEKSRVPSEDVFLSLEAKPIVKLVKMFGKRDFLSRVFDMEIYRGPDSVELKESLQVLPRNLNYGPGKTNILNLQLLRAPPDKLLTLGVSIEFLGLENCPGLRKGGVLRKLAKFVLYKCKASELPAKIVVDMSVLEIGDRVVVQDLEVDFDMLESDRLMPVCEIIKDVSTQKWKLKRQKNKMFFKTKAIAEKENAKRFLNKNPGKAQQVSDQEDVEEDFEDDVELPKRLKKLSDGIQKSSIEGSSPENIRKNRNSSKRRLVGSRVSRNETGKMVKIRNTSIGNKSQKKDSDAKSKSILKPPKKRSVKAGQDKKKGRVRNA